MSFAIDHHGTIHELGDAEEVINERGNHAGNWLESARAPDAASVALARRIVERGRDLGYVGWAGIDVVSTRDQRRLVIDANFRPVSSTMAVELSRRFGSDSGIRSSFGRGGEGLPTDSIP